MKPVPDGDRTPVRVPFSLGAALTHLGRRHDRLRRSATWPPASATWRPSSPPVARALAPGRTRPGPRPVGRGSSEPPGGQSSSGRSGRSRRGVELSSSLPSWPGPLWSSSRVVVGAVVSRGRCGRPHRRRRSLPGPLSVVGVVEARRSVGRGALTVAVRTRTRTTPSSSSTLTWTRAEPERKSTSISRPAACSTSTRQPAGRAGRHQAERAALDGLVTVPAPAASIVRTADEPGGEVVHVAVVDRGAGGRVVVDRGGGAASVAVPCRRTAGSLACSASSQLPGDVALGTGELKHGGRPVRRRARAAKAVAAPSVQRRLPRRVRWVVGRWTWKCPFGMRLVGATIRPPR